MTTRVPARFVFVLSVSLALAFAALLALLADLTAAYGQAPSAQCLADYDGVGFTYLSLSPQVRSVNGLAAGPGG